MSINLSGKTEIADYMIIATGTSSRHVGSIADKLLLDLKKSDIVGIEPEGTETCDWVLIDAGDIIIHLFKPETREMYDLEGMWSMGAKPEKKAKKV